MSRFKPIRPSETMPGIGTPGLICETFEEWIPCPTCGLPLGLYRYGSRHRAFCYGTYNLMPMTRPRFPAGWIGRSYDSREGLIASLQMAAAMK